MTAIVTTPNPDNGSIAVAVVDIPEGYEYATIYRSLDGVTTTLVDNVFVVGGRVDAVDYAAPPGWTVTYTATVVSTRGANLAVNPSVEQGDVGWSSNGTTRKVRSDGSAHTGARYYRANGSSGSPPLITAAVSTVVPGYVSGTDFETSETTTTTVVSSSTEDFVRAEATAVTPTIAIAYATLLTGVTAGQPVTPYVIYRTNMLGPPATGWVQLKVRWYNLLGTLLGTSTVGSGSLRSGWTILTSPTSNAPSGASRCRLTIEATRQASDISYSTGDRLEVAYFQAWAGNQVPTAASFFHQQIPCTPGLTYQGEVWVRRGSPLGVNYMRVDTSFRDAADLVVGSTTLGFPVATPTGWSLIRGAQAIAPANAATVRILVRGTSNEGNTVNPNPGESYDLDDLYITDNVPLAVNTDPVSDSVAARFIGDAWLKDPHRPGVGMQVMVNEQPSLARAGEVGLHRVSGRARPVAVTDVRSSETGELRLVTRNEAERDQLVDLLAPGSVVLFQTTPEAMLPAEMYMVIDEATEERVVPLVNESWRIHNLSFTVVDAPGQIVVSVPNTYDDVRRYAVTYQNVIDRRLSYLELLNNSFNPTPPPGGTQSAVRV